MLHKSSEIQWNITGTLPRKLKRKIFWLYTTRYPVSNYGFEVNNRNTRTRCEICWKLTIKILWTYFTPCYSVSIVNFEHVYASWVLPPEITKTWEIAFFWGGGGRVHWRHGNQCGIQWLFMILWISERFSLYLLVKNSFIFKLGFSTCFEYISAGIIRKTILHSDYYSARWYRCKKDQKNLSQTSHKFFSQCLIVNSSLLWVFMV